MGSVLALLWGFYCWAAGPLEVAWTPPKRWEAGELTVFTRHAGASKEIASCSYSLVDNRVSMKTRVERGFRRQGVNQLLVQRILENHPQITQVSSNLQEVNAAALALAFLSPEFAPADVEKMRSRLHEELLQQKLMKRFIQSIKRLTLKKELLAVRILDAFRRGTPAGKIYRRFGFADTREIHVWIKGQAAELLFETHFGPSAGIPRFTLTIE